MKMKDSFYKKILDNVIDGIYFVDKQSKITYWNLGAEKISGFKKSDVVGRHCYDNILKHIDAKGNQLCFNGCPLQKTIDDGKDHDIEVYLYHKQGHRVPVHVYAKSIKDQQGEIIGAVEVFRDNTQIIMTKQRIEEYKKLAFVDTLTGLANRRYMEEVLNNKSYELNRYGWRFGLLLIDIDRFKTVNDTYGHDVGDQVLKMLANTLLNGVRYSDVVGRWGGEEFIAVIDYVTDADFLKNEAERLRVLVEQSSIINGENTIGVTVSIGGVMPKKNQSADSMLIKADQLLYKSKASGRNCVTIEL